MSKWSEGAEGFICPYCLVSFNSSNKLQAHFIDFHSGEGNDAAVIVESDSNKVDVLQDQLGHCWVATSIPKPRSCEACDVIIWSSSYTCQVCQMVIHPDQKCQEQVTKTCTSDIDDFSEHGAPLPRANAPPPAKAISDIVKRQVAKGRNRYTSDGFDLDLSYITERIIAMSFPGSGVESAYRNNLKDVAKLLKRQHQDNYLVFNLSERCYDISKFNNQVLDFGWPDHLAPSLERLSIVCKSMKSWLDSDPQHVVVVHCKGGKGRTGCVIAAFMHYSQICQSASAALDHFAMKRFYDDKLQGVTQPSQRRYVHYFEDLLTGKIKLDARPIKLCYILIHGIPNFDGKGGCRPFIKIYQNMELVHTSGLYVCTSEKDRVKISLYGGLKLEGEVLIKCFHKKTHTGVDSVFRCQFHHCVVNDCRVVWTKQDLDDAFKDKRFADDIKVELIFEATTPQANQPIVDDVAHTDLRHSLLADRKRESMMESFPLGSYENRNSYLHFQGGYDNGRPQDLMHFTEPSERDRSSTSDSYKMDPSLIERVVADGGDIYTVVNKTNESNSRDHTPERQAILAPRPLHSIAQREADLSSSYGSPKYSHLVHNKSRFESRLKPSRPPPPAGYSLISTQQIQNSQQSTSSQVTKNVLPGYEDITERKLILTPVSPQSNQKDNDMWMSIKWQALPQESDLSSYRRSSSQTAIDLLLAQEEYTNLAQISNERPVVVQQRRHSFSEGKANSSQRESIIRIENPGTTSSIDDDTYTVPPDALYSNVSSDDDYVNYNAADYSHDYLNEEELREQIRNSPHIPLDEEIIPATVTQQKVPALGFKDILMENLRIKKPTVKTVIQSSAMNDIERKKAIPMFHLDNASGRGLQVGRGDYMEFTIDSWGDNVDETPNQGKIKVSDTCLPSIPPKKQPLQSDAAGITNDIHFTGLYIQDEISQKLNPIPVSKKEPPPKPPLPSGYKQHRPVQSVKSQPMVTKATDCKASQGGRNIPPTKVPPKPPAPYQSDSSKVPLSYATAQVKDLMSYWYRPDITREEACSLVKQMDPGLFIVRDSQTVSGGYALTIKVSEELLRQRRKLTDEIEVTNDMCVTHFLIQPDPEGVKLQGWNEPAFKTLPDFIAKHTIDKLCLPCVLNLPNQSPDTVPSKKYVDTSHLSAAACDLVLLGNIEVLHSSGDSVITEAARQLKALDLPTSTIVNFKASMGGITVTDKASGHANKRNYSIFSITYCGLDPTDTRWDLSHLSERIPIRNKPCFGIVHKMQGNPGYMCLLFAEIDTHQPVSNVVAYVKRLINLAKQS